MGRVQAPADNAARPLSRRELLSAAAAIGAGFALASAIPASANPFPVRRSHVQINGASIYLIEQGEGPAVLFCHGFPDTSETWLSQMRAVAQEGYRAVALDMRGYGGSYAPEEASLYSSLHIVGDLVGTLDALGISSAVLVGHDWGADHCWRAMLMRPDRFHAMVSLSIPYMPRGDISHWDALRQQGLEARSYYFDMLDPDAEERFAPAAATIPSVLYWLSASPPAATRWSPNDPARHMLRTSPLNVPDWTSRDYVQHTVRAFEKTGFRGGLNYYRALQATFDLTAAFKNAVVRQPSLYICGAADGLNEVFHPTPPTLDELRQAMPGLRNYVRLENTGHWIQHEAADRVNEELVRFLGSIETPR
jgi:pimeloyl-ACP methyl ester carboxylesterase